MFSGACKFFENIFLEVAGAVYIQNLTRKKSVLATKSVIEVSIEEPI